MFRACLQNNTKQIFIACRELSDVKTSNILGVINLDKIKNWEYIKGKSLSVIANFDNLKKKTEDFCFSFKRSSLNDLLLFCIYFIDDDNRPITFVGG